MNEKYNRNCPDCGKKLSYASLISMNHSKNRKCMSCSKRGNKGNPNGFTGKHSVETKQKMSVSASKDRILRNSDGEYLKKLSNSIKVAMHRPEVREKHLAALHHSKWIKVRTDKGQLELIDKWNKLGFEFEPNYQLHTDQDLFYIDGYDKKHGVVLEYDSKYHNKSDQKQKDLIRQNKIIDILKPKKFFRYDAVNKVIENVKGK
jgi:hypothetical protein